MISKISASHLTVCEKEHLCLSHSVTFNKDQYLPLPTNHIDSSVYQDPFYSNPSNSSQLPVPFIDTIVQAIDVTKYILSGLSSNSQKDYIMGTAFSLYNQDSANQILTDWARNNFTNTQTS